MIIRVLSDQLASQIAAGEVVERPASVVKELVENALDAGATTINVDIRQSGQGLIQVADNGSGIPAEQIETAFLRHATSKLQSSDDLNAIYTLGFRGEALAAIAAVSQVTIVTRAENEPAGTRLKLEGGHKTNKETVGAPQGSVIAIENLFYNVPARRKFLKSAATERRQIDEFITRYALAYPAVRFRLTHDGRITFQTNGTNNLRDVLVSVYGADIAREFLEIASPQPTEEDSTPSEIQNPKSKITVSGFVGPPSLHRSNKSQITLFVNGRWIKDTRLTYAIIQAYHTLLPTGRFPIAIVFVRMPADQLDVNVHPAKTEVRFRISPFGAVQRAIRKTLIEGSPVRQVGSVFSQFQPNVSRPGWEGRFNQSAFQSQPEARQEQGGLGLDWSMGDGQADAQTPIPQLSGTKLPIMRVVGQVGASYIITEGPDGLFLIDQHAAHERILYEKFMAERQNDAIPSQGLVTGTAVQVTPAQATLLHEQLALLSTLGFQIEPFGPGSFMVRGIPAILAKQDPAGALLSVIEDLEREKTPLQSEIEARIIKRVCKTASVKQGQTLSTIEMEEMIKQLEACHNPHTCPHGRPTLIHLSVAQLAHQFGRL